MNHPANLSRDELVEIVISFVQGLYGRKHHDDSWTFAADNDWGDDGLDGAIGLLRRFDLVPVIDEPGESMDPVRLETSRTAFVLYDFDLGELVTTRVYSDHEDAVGDATMLNNVLVLPLQTG